MPESNACTHCHRSFQYPAYKGVVTAAKIGKHDTYMGPSIPAGLPEEEKQAVLKRFHDMLFPESILAPCCPFCHEPLYPEKTEENRGD